MSAITREEARQAFEVAGLTYLALTPESMKRLRAIVNDHMKYSGAIKGTYRCKLRGVVKETRAGRYAELRCKSYYFNDREAITFNTDGFIGFAGWADQGNVQPILKGFVEWVKEAAALARKDGAA